MLGARGGKIKDSQAAVDRRDKFRIAAHRAFQNLFGYRVVNQGPIVWEKAENELSFVSEDKYDDFEDFYEDLLSETVPIITKLPVVKHIKSYDDSTISLTAPRKKIGISGRYKQTVVRREESRRLEAKLQNLCIKYARRQGFFPYIWDKDSNPDIIIFDSKGLVVGMSEFKSSTGRHTKGQGLRIAELRGLFGDNEAARIFRRFEDFKVWLNSR